MIRSVFKTVRKTTKWAFLLTLPITFVPLFSGFLGGVLWAFWNSNHVSLTTNKWLHEIKYSLEDWGVGGGVMSFHEYENSPKAFGNPFGVWRVDSTDWLRRLGFDLPIEYVGQSESEQQDVPIDKYADLTTLIRDTSCPSEAEKPKEQWLFLTNYQWLGFSEWNEAFKYVTRYAQGDPRLNETALFYAECERNAGFLCGVWSTRAPALVHFLVEDESKLPDEGGQMLTYRASPDAMRPVTARIIEFPLKDAYTGHTSNAILSREEQMLAIMTGDHLYEQFEPYHPMNQMMKRFNDYMDTFGNKRGEPLWYIWELDGWMIKHVAEPLGVDEALNFLHTLTFILVGGSFQTFVLGPIRLAKELAGDFVGKPKQGDWVLGNSGIVEEDDLLLSENWMDTLIASLQEKADAASSESVRENVSGERTIPPTTSTTSTAQ